MNNDPVLVPMPRELAHQEGSLALQSSRYILLDGARTSGLERADRVVQEVLAEVGASLELTEHREWRLKGHRSRDQRGVHAVAA